MRESRLTIIIPPLGHVERHRPSRERSALTTEDLDKATVIRRAAAQLGRDLAASAGHIEWRDVPDELRADMKDLMIGAISKRLGDARVQLKLLAGIGNVPLAAAERVAKLERALDAAKRLP
jgi:hypothetical protein